VLAAAYFDNASEDLWITGTAGVLPHVDVVKNGFRNMSEEAVSDWLQLTPDSATTDQYLWKQA